MIVQLTRQVLALFFLRRHQLLRELAHQVLGFFGDLALVLRTSLENAQADNGGQRDDETKDEASPEEPVQLGAKLVLPARDLGALDGVVGVVQLFDLRGDRQDRFAPREHLAPQEAGALADLFDERPVEEWIERLPVLVELGLEAGDALFALRTAFGNGAEIGDRRHVVAAELGQTLAINRRVLALRIEQVVADEDT